MGSVLSSLGLNDLLGGNNNIGYSASQGYNDALSCCEGVVDPLTLLAVLGTIIGATVWFRQVIIDNVKMARKRRRRSFTKISNKNLFFYFLKGTVEGLEIKIVWLWNL